MNNNLTGTCPYCGAALHENASFCPNCAKSINVRISPKPLNVKLRKARRIAMLLLVLAVAVSGLYMANSLWSNWTAVPTISIAGVEYRTDLTELDLREFDLTDQDIKPLAALTGLEVLRLSPSPQLTDLTPLTNLTGLRELVIYSGVVSGIQNIEMLAGLENLEILKLILGGVEDFSALAGLTKLTTLNLDGTIIMKDLSLLHNMTMLQQLEISSEDSAAVFVQDLSDFSGLSQLRQLILTTSGLESLSGVEQLSQLKVLRISGRDSTYTNLTPLQNLVLLEEVQLPILSPNHSGSVDISGLTDAVKLTSLTIDHNILDLEPLRGLQNLETLSIIHGFLKAEANLYETFEPLKGLPNLTSLSIRRFWYGDSPISLAPLGDLANLKTLQLEIDVLGNDQSLDISPLRRLENLTSVTISGANTVLDWSPVDHVSTVSKN